MNNLKKISSYSSYKPEAGEVKELYDLIREGVTRQRALELWKKEGKTPDHFRHVLKNLKDKLLIHSFDTTSSKLSLSQKKRIECWKKFSTVKCLLIADEREASVKLAIETLALAERYTLLDIRLSLSKELLLYYSLMSPNKKLYEKYHHKLEEAKRDMSNHSFALSLLCELYQKHNKKKDFEYLSEDISQLKMIMSEERGFNTFRFFTLSFWFRIHKDFDNVAKTCLEAIDYFSKRKGLVPYANVWTYYNQLIPIQIAAGKFEETENYSIVCLELPAAGSHNWHNALFHRSLLGFYSDKPLIALDAWKRASKLRMHNNLNIDERWEIVRAYLVMYHLLGRISFPEPFRLRKFLNSVPKGEAEKQDDNIAIIIAQLLLLLLSNDRNGYMEKSDLLPAYIHKHLRGEKNKRAKCILHMMTKVESGNYYRTRTNLKAQRWARALRKAPRNIASLSELVPYEMVWDIVLKQLK